VVVCLVAVLRHFTVVEGAVRMPLGILMQPNMTSIERRDAGPIQVNVNSAKKRHKDVEKTSREFITV